MEKSNISGPVFIFLIVLLSFFKHEGFVNPLKGTMSEIENIGFNNIIGVDQLDSDGKIKVTISHPEFRMGGQGSEAFTVKNAVLSATGKTAYDAHRNLHQLSSKKLAYGHVDYIVLGESVASDGLEEALEFQMRDYERSWFAQIAIAKDVTAEQFILEASKKETTIANQIKGINQSTQNLSITAELKLFEVFDRMQKRNPDFCIPVLTIEAKKADTEQVTAEKISAGGFAVIKDNQLYGFLDEELSRGVNWINGNIDSLGIVVSISEYQNCSLEVLASHSKIKTYFMDDMPIAEIDIRVESNINELGEIENLSMNELIEMLQKKQADFVKTEAVAALNYSQENGVDILGIGDSVFHQHPLKWKDIEDHWSVLFNEMKVKINIQSYVVATGEIREKFIESGDKR